METPHKRKQYTNLTPQIRLTCVGEEESRVVEGNHGAGLPVDVALADEEVDESLPHLGRRPFHRLLPHGFLLATRHRWCGCR